MMKRKKLVSSISSVRKFGQGLLNTLIKKLPVEIYIQGYRFCGPGTKPKKRLLRGGTGINPLDEACKLHDLAYSQTDNISKCLKADKVLEEAGSKKLISSSSNIGKKMAALV